MMTTHGVFGNTGTQYSYDVMGRLNFEPSYIHDGGYGTATYKAFDLAGNPLIVGYPDGRWVSQSFDGAGQLTNIGLIDRGSGQSVQEIVQSITYFPDGTPQTMTLGNGVVQQVAKNNRLQVQSIENYSNFDPFGQQKPFLSRQLTYGSGSCATATSNNGSICSVVDALPGGRKTQNFAYDGLNRLTSFAEPSMPGVQPQAYSIDAFGNNSFPVFYGSSSYTPSFQTTGTNTYNPCPSGYPNGCNRVTNLPVSSLFLNGGSPYDAAGNLGYDLDQNQTGVQYTWDGENHLQSITSLLNPGSPFELYDYGADGARVRKYNPTTGEMIEYADFGGEELADWGEFGNAWKDHVYANGQRVADLPTIDHWVHASGNGTSVYGDSNSWSLLWGQMPTPQNPTSRGPGNYQVQQGDQLCFRQYANNASGGPFLTFSDGEGSMFQWSAEDRTFVPSNAGGGWMASDNQGLNQMSDNWNQWVSRCVALSQGSTVGTTITGLYLGTNWGYPGHWDIYYADMSIISLDGTVTSIIGSSPPSALYVTGNGNYATSNEQFTLNGDPPAYVNGLMAQAATHFFLNDHLGSSTMELTSGGWPVVSTQYMPFGGEINSAAATDNRYKFTGKERDKESGLDYFGARYMSSNMGRFMSPDDFSKDTNLADPQSLNKYAYARNNPLRYIDPTGETATVATSCSTADNKTTCSVNVTASIAIYADKGSGLTSDQLAGAATTIAGAIDKAWSGSFEKDGVTYNVTTQVTVSVADSLGSAEKSGAQNVVGISNGAVGGGANSVAGVGRIKGQDAGDWNFNTLGKSSAHEFTHLLGVDNRSDFGLVLSNEYMFRRPSNGRATAYDFGTALRETTTHINAAMNKIKQTGACCGPIQDTTTVGAPRDGKWKQ